MKQGLKDFLFFKKMILFATLFLAAEVSLQDAGIHNVYLACLIPCIGWGLFFGIFF